MPKIEDLKSTLPLKIQLLYGIGVSYAILDQIFVQWVLYYYLPPSNSGLLPLISPIGITISLIIARFVDMIFDPIVGYASDHIRTPWGRRIPFVFIGALPLVLCTIGFFYPIDFLPITVHLPLVGSLFFICYSVVGAPYNALISELSQTSDDRLNLSTWQSVFRLVYSAIAMILPGILIAHFGGGDTEKGIRGMVIALSAFALIGMLITSFTVNETKYAAHRANDVKTPFKEAISHMIHNRNFLFYLGGFLFFFIGFNTLRTCINYYVEDIMGFGKEYITMASAALFLTSGAFFYPINRLSRKTGYKRLVMASLALLIVLTIALYNLGKTLPISAGIWLFGLMGIPISGLGFIFPPAMLSDIISKEHDNSGVSIDGLFFGIQGFFLKMAFLISIGVVPLLLVTGNGANLMEAIAGGPTGVTQPGIYGTTLFALGSFVLSAVFYWFYRE